MPRQKAMTQETTRTGAHPRFVRPEGGGWRLVGSCSEPGEGGLTKHTWNWEREVVEVQGEEPQEYLTQHG